MSGTEPVGLLHVEIVYERPSANRVSCHARCVGVGRSVFPGDSMLPVDSRVLRMRRPPFGAFSELPPVWHAVVELEAAEGTDLSWVRAGANLRVVLPGGGR